LLPTPILNSALKVMPPKFRRPPPPQAAGSSNQTPDDEDSFFSRNTKGLAGIKVDNIGALPLESIL
jgi:hypothetical protein